MHHCRRSLTRSITRSLYLFAVYKFLLTYAESIKPTMDLIHDILNLVALPVTFFSACFILPPFLLFKYFISLFNSIFTENVAGKVVLITGASSGIGEYLAYEYARRGACLSLVARREKSLHEVAERARRIGSPDVIVITADVSKLDDCRRIVDETTNHFTRLDHLVNNAGIVSFCKFEDVARIDDFRTVMDINFWGSVYTTYFAVPHLRNTGGRIIVLSSASESLPNPRRSFYNASKAAMSIMFETLRVELGPDIKVTTVSPLMIESEATTGKYLNREGKIEVVQELRDVDVSIVPIMRVERCAKAIVRSACRGDRHVVEPAWSKVAYWWKVLFPELMDLGLRMMYLQSQGRPDTEAPSKKLLDLTGAKEFLFPTSIQSPEIKTD